MYRLAASIKIKFDSKFSSAINRRAFSTDIMHEHALKKSKSRSSWKYTYDEYKKALIAREKCKQWKQLGYGMHEGYCTSKSCDCTYRLFLIAKK